MAGLAADPEQGEEILKLGAPARGTCGTIGIVPIVEAFRGFKLALDDQGTVQIMPLLFRYLEVKGGTSDRRPNEDLSAPRLHYYDLGPSLPNRVTLSFLLPEKFLRLQPSTTCNRMFVSVWVFRIRTRKHHLAPRSEP